MTLPGPPMKRARAVAELLEGWRLADRRWEGTSPDDPHFRDAAIEVVRAWLEYHLATDPSEPGEVALVADDDRRYVAVSPSVEETLGYQPSDLIGRLVDDLAAPAMTDGTGERWSRFVEEGRQDGSFPMLASDGSVVTLQYQARAHFPIAGFHLSRLWLDHDGV